MNVLDLFSGVGGFSLGLERAGMQTVAFCEIDPFCRAVLKKHWPGVPCFEDVRSLHASDVGKIDVICGGFPCQDISYSGKRAGIDGARSGLWGEFARLIGELRPGYVIVENVAALLDGGLGRVLGDLAALGFDAEWDCIPASAIGAYHERDRIWILAYPAGKYGDARRCVVPRGEWRAPFQSGRFHRSHVATRGQQTHARLECEPGLARLVHGIPNRTHRLAALGNAVVPQIPEIIGRAILMAESAAA